MTGRQTDRPTIEQQFAELANSRLSRCNLIRQRHTERTRVRDPNQITRAWTVAVSVLWRSWDLVGKSDQNKNVFM